MIDYQKAVCELRDKLVMTQTEFAKYLGVSFASINRWENGTNKPTTSVKKRLLHYAKRTILNWRKRNNE